MTNKTTTTTTTTTFDPCKHCQPDFFGNCPCDYGTLCEYMCAPTTTNDKEVQ